MRFVKANSWLLVLMALLIVIPIVVPSMAFVNIVAEMLIMALFAVSVNLLIGYTGVVSFGHSAFFAIGSYTTGIMLQRMGESLPLAIPVVLIVGMVLSGIIALVIGYFCTRLTAVYFAFLTLAFSQVIYAIIIKWKGLTGGDQGLVGGVPKPPLNLFGWAMDMTSPFTLYYFIVVVVCGALLVVKLVTDSPFGWVLRGIRDNAERMKFLGINVRRYMIIVFVISGVFTGLAGGLIGLHISGAYPDHAYWTKSAEPIFMIMVGGMRVFAGPILGAIIVTELSAYLSSYIGLWGLIFGGILIVFLMVSRQGILDVLTRKWPIFKRLGF